MMFTWSFSLIQKIIDNKPLMYASLWVTCLNMLFQLFYDVAFGIRSLTKVRGRK